MLGERLGAYQIDRELGAGGMGTVYAATVVDRAPGLSAGDRVALKVVRPHLFETQGFFQRFLREAQVGTSIRHENVVRTYLADALVPHHFLVMEYVEGQDLRQLLGELQRVPEQLCRHIGREVARGLAAIHAAGAVHRDLKPENVIVAERTEGDGAVAPEGVGGDDVEYVVKIMDLGVALLADQQIRLSQSGAFVGSLEYAAPEQFRARGLDHRCDLHALGLLLYELSCGLHPFRAEDFRGVMKRICEEQPRRVGHVNPQLSPFFEEVVHTLLAKSPDDRFASANELLGVLDEGEDSEWWHERARQLQASTHRPLRRVRIPRETAVHGREDELARLRQLYEQASSGDGRVVLLEGEAGIGKSRLVDELIARLSADGEDLNFLFGSYPPGGAATASGAFSTAYREHLGEGGSAAYLTRSPVLISAFDALLAGDAPPTGIDPLTKDSLQTCFVNVTCGLAAERVTVILIDDLHFAPDEGRALFSSLAMAVPGRRVLLIGSMRPGVSRDWVANLSRLQHTRQVTLTRLGHKDLAALLADCFDSEQLALDLAGRIGVKSDGNPFFAFEIVRGLREGNFVRQREDGSWVSTQAIDEIEIPSSVLDLVNARVADLSEEERDLLDVACCWGFEFDPGLVGDVLGVARIPLLKRLSQIERRHRLVRAVGRTMVFDHHQVQEALHASLLPQLREEYHALLAEALETRTNAANRDPAELDGALCVDLCEHYLQGARGPAAMRYLDAAILHLTRGYLHAHVVSLLEQAHAMPGLLAGAARAESLLRAVAALDHVGRSARQEELAREADELAMGLDDAALQARAASALGNVFLRASRADDAEAAFRRGLDIALAAEDPRAEAAARACVAQVLTIRGEVADAQAEIERSLALNEAIGDRSAAARTSGNLGSVLWTQGRFDEARELMMRALAFSRDAGDLAAEASASSNLGSVAFLQGRVADARTFYERFLELSRETGNRRGEANGTMNLGLVLYSEGRLVEAMERHEHSLALHRELGSSRGEAIALVNLGPVWIGLGDLTRARQAFERSLVLCREIGAKYPEGYALAGLTSIAREEGDHEQALKLAEEGLTLRRSIRHGDGICDSLMELGNLHRRSGDIERARVAIDEALKMSREQGRKGRVALALAALACLPGGEVDAATSALAEAGPGDDTRMLRWLLWTATRDRLHLQEARIRLDASLAKVPEKYRDAMRSALRLNREILAACAEELVGGEDGTPGDDHHGTESITRVG